MDDAGSFYYQHNSDGAQFNDQQYLQNIQNRQVQPNYDGIDFYAPVKEDASVEAKAKI